MSIPDLENLVVVVAALADIVTEIMQFSGLVESNIPYF